MASSGSSWSGIRFIVRLSSCLEILGDGRGRLLQSLHQVGRIAVVLRRNESDGCALVPCPPCAAWEVTQRMATAASDTAWSCLQSELLKTGHDNRL